MLPVPKVASRDVRLQVDPLIACDQHGDRFLCEKFANSSSAFYARSQEHLGYNNSEKMFLVRFIDWMDKLVSKSCSMTPITRIKVIIKVGGKICTQTSETVYWKSIKKAIIIVPVERTF